MSDPTDEATLADAPTLPAEVEATIADTTPKLDPKTFDLESFIEGARPTRRGFRLYDQAHLIACLEQLADDIDRLPDGPEINALIDEFERVKAEFQTGTWWEVEGRSEEWIEHYRTQAADVVDCTIDKDGDAVDSDGKKNSDAERKILLGQLTQQVVTPAGITVAQMADLATRLPVEFNKIIAAVALANTQLPEKAAVLTRDFSQRRSTRTGRRRSSMR